MEVEWAPNTPEREDTKPSARTRIQNKNNSRTQLDLTLIGSKKQHVKTKKRGANMENVNKKFQWVAATLSQETIDYITNQPIYILTGKREHKHKKDNTTGEYSPEEEDGTASQGNLRRAPWENINEEQRKRYKQEMKQITLARKGPSGTTKMGTTYDP